MNSSDVFDCVSFKPLAKVSRVINVSESMEATAARSKLRKYYAPNNEENQARGIIAKTKCTRITDDGVRCHGEMVMRRSSNYPLAQSEMKYIVYCKDCGNWYETESVPSVIAVSETVSMMKGSN
jgi:hypothetical protein